MKQTKEKPSTLPVREPWSSDKASQKIKWTLLKELKTLKPQLLTQIEDRKKEVFPAGEKLWKDSRMLVFCDTY